MSEPTPERVLKGESYLSPTGLRTFKDEPIQRLHARGALWPKSADINTRLLEAAQRYAKDHYLANMNPLASFDPTRVFSGGTGAGGVYPASEKQLEHRQAHRAAQKAVGKFYLEAVNLVVIHEENDLAAIGRKISGLSSPDAGRAVAMERLRAGLYLLAMHYGTLGTVH